MAVTPQVTIALSETGAATTQRAVKGVRDEVRGLAEDAPKAGRGVFFKAPKPGQDRRIDLPTLGPGTVERAAKAGLAGIAWEAGGVILLDRPAMVAAAEAAGLFLWAREP